MGQFPLPRFFGSAKMFLETFSLSSPFTLQYFFYHRLYYFNCEASLNNVANGFFLTKMQRSHTDHNFLQEHNVDTILYSYQLAWIFFTGNGYEVCTTFQIFLLYLSEKYKKLIFPFPKKHIYIYLYQNTMPPCCDQNITIMSEYKFKSTE